MKDSLQSNVRRRVRISGWMLAFLVLLAFSALFLLTRHLISNGRPTSPSGAEVYPAPAPRR